MVTNPIAGLTQSVWVQTDLAVHGPQGPCHIPNGDPEDGWDVGSAPQARLYDRPLLYKVQPCLRLGQKPCAFECCSTKVSEELVQSAFRDRETVCLGIQNDDLPLGVHCGCSQRDECQSRRPGGLCQLAQGVCQLGAQGWIQIIEILSPQRRFKQQPVQRQVGEASRSEVDQVNLHVLYLLASIVKHNLCHVVTFGRTYDQNTVWASVAYDIDDHIKDIRVRSGGDQEVGRAKQWPTHLRRSRIVTNATLVVDQSRQVAGIGTKDVQVLLAKSCYAICLYEKGAQRLPALWKHQRQHQ